MDGTDDGSDPALARVRDELARLGTDEDSAPEVPAAVTARVGAALQSARRGPAHAIQPSGLPRLQVLGLVAGIGAVLLGVIVGASMLARGPAPRPASGPTAEHITVSRPSPPIPLSDPQIVGLLTRAPDYGPLTEPHRRASCLDGLGYSAATTVLGARPLDMYGRPAVMLLLPGDTPDAVVAMVVEPNCSAADTGLLANTVVTRP